MRDRSVKHHDRREAMMVITGQTTAGVTIRGTKLACGAAELVREPAADLASGNVERIGRVAGKLAE